MARRGENIYKRKDGRWEGRYKSGVKADGTARYSSIYGKTYAEVKQKIPLDYAEYGLIIAKGNNLRKGCVYSIYH